MVQLDFLFTEIKEIKAPVTNQNLVTNLILIIDNT